MSFMFEVYYKAPADPRKEADLAQRVASLGGRLDYREAAEGGVNGAVCLTFEFNGRADAEAAARVLRHKASMSRGRWIMGSRFSIRDISGWRGQ
jgi:hypothetical protein